MIGSFKDKNAKALYEGKTVKKWKSLSKQVGKRLQILDMAAALDDLRNLPSNKFEALKGKRKGQYSIRVNRQWRICFTWKNGKPHHVEVVDYH